jgi:IS6 family transposase
LSASAWYLRYCLRYRDLEEIMAERGVGRAFDYRLLGSPLSSSAQPVDSAGNTTSEPVVTRGRDVRACGRLLDLVRRGADSAGKTLEFLLSSHRDLVAAKGVLQLVLSAGPVRPRVINVDGHPAYTSAINELKNSGELSQRCRCRPSPYMNNIIELGSSLREEAGVDRGFCSAGGALNTIAGYEAMNIIRKVKSAGWKRATLAVRSD